MGGGTYQTSLFPLFGWLVVIGGGLRVWVNAMEPIMHAGRNVAWSRGPWIHQKN